MVRSYNNVIMAISGTMSCSKHNLALWPESVLTLEAGAGLIEAQGAADSLMSIIAGGSPAGAAIQCSILATLGETF